MYLRAPQLWWAYLGVKSHKEISRLVAESDRAIFFDDASQLPRELLSWTDPRARYFLVCWDGLTDEAPIEDALHSLPPNVDMTTLVVGDYSAVGANRYRIESLYPEGPLEFEERPRLDVKTATTILAARLKGLAAPVKNTIKSRDFAENLKLLLGRKRVVFCGSVGLTKPVLEMLCNRYGIDSALFHGHQFFSSNEGLGGNDGSLDDDGAFLASLYDRSKICRLFFLSAVHLLGREYFVWRIRRAGLSIWVNRFVEDSYVDVYSTPFYSQHVFLDFGSVVGKGNYPRLADLTYFKKAAVRIDLGDDLDQVLPVARSRSLAHYFDQEWALKAPHLMQLMH